MTEAAPRKLVSAAAPASCCLRFELKEDEHYTAFLEAVKERPPGVPLLTVSNHCSPLDDPAVLVGMLPPSLTMRPERMRWTICAQEICFKWAAAAAALGSAKVGVLHYEFMRFFKAKGKTDVVHSPTCCTGAWICSPVMYTGNHQPHLTAVA